MSPMGLSFWQECRRVRNDKLKRELGVTLYPTYREGLRLFEARWYFPLPVGEWVGGPVKDGSSGEGQSLQQV